MVHYHHQHYQTIQSDFGVGHNCRKDSTKSYLSGSLNLHKIYRLSWQHCTDNRICPVLENAWKKYLIQNTLFILHTYKRQMWFLYVFCSKSIKEQYEQRSFNKQKARECRNSDKESAMSWNDLEVACFYFDKSWLWHHKVLIHVCIINVVRASSI